MVNRLLSPDVKPISIGEYYSPEIVKLDNGINLHIVNLGSQEVVQIELIFKAGTAVQSKKLVAEFTNKMLQEGTANFTAKTISETIDYLGAFLEFKTTKDFSSCTLYALNSKFQEALEIFKEVVLNPIFPKNEFELLRANAKQKFLVGNQKNEVVARREFTKSIFKNTVYGQVVEEQDFECVQVSDLEEYYKRNYSSKNCEILLSGFVNKEIKQLVHEVFGKSAWGNQNYTAKEYLSSNYKPKKIIVQRKDSVQSAIRIGKRAVKKNHKDYIDLKILNTILGGYFGSRLMSNIREDKGYTYGIGSGVFSFLHEGQFVVSTEVGVDVTKNALDEIYKEIKRLQTELVPNEELNLVKNYMLGQLLSAFDGPFAVAESYKNVFLYGLNMEYYIQYEKRIKEMTLDKILNLAKEYLAIDSLTEVVVGKIN